MNQTIAQRKAIHRVADRRTVELRRRYESAHWIAIGLFAACLVAVCVGLTN